MLINLLFLFDNLNLVIFSKIKIWYKIEKFVLYIGCLDCVKKERNDILLFFLFLMILFFISFIYLFCLFVLLEMGVNFCDCLWVYFMLMEENI